MSLKQFVPMKKIGQGAYATVYQCKRNNDQQMYALKKIKINFLSYKQKDNALNEIRLLASITSPYIITYYESFFDEQSYSLCIVMQYANGGDLQKFIKSHKISCTQISQIQIWKFLIHLLYGLKSLHDRTILHRDLKTANIFISEGIYKIGDMNVSKVMKEGFALTQTGTPYYSSPEIWNGCCYNEKSDIWSLGCILYEMAALRAPFEGQSLQELHNNIMRGTYKKIPKFYSDELNAIIRKCLNQDPECRPSTQQLLSNWTIKMYENICIEFNPVLSPENEKLLLKTIHMPKNTKMLHQQLPKSNYVNHECQDQKIQIKDKSIQQINLVKDNYLEQLENDCKLEQESEKKKNKQKIETEIQLLKDVRRVQSVKWDEDKQNCEIVLLKKFISEKKIILEEKQLNSIKEIIDDQNVQNKQNSFQSCTSKKNCLNQQSLIKQDKQLKSINNLLQKKKSIRRTQNPLKQHNSNKDKNNRCNSNNHNNNSSHSNARNDKIVQQIRRYNKKVKSIYSIEPMKLNNNYYSKFSSKKNIHQMEKQKSFEGQKAVIQRLIKEQKSSQKSIKKAKIFRNKDQMLLNRNQVFERITKAIRNRKRTKSYNKPYDFSNKVHSSHLIHCQPTEFKNKQYWC